MISNIKSLFALSLLVLLVQCGDSQEKKQDVKSTAGVPAVVSFSLPDLQGRTLTLESLGKPLVLVDFWTTWCPPCRESIPHLNDFYRNNRDRIAVVGVSLDTKPAPDVAAFARAMEIAYPVVTGGRDLAVTYGITSIPTIIITDGSGNIVRRHTGMADLRTLESLIKGL